jgi:hypothetical protein
MTKYPVTQEIFQTARRTPDGLYSVFDALSIAKGVTRLEASQEWATALKEYGNHRGEYTFDIVPEPVCKMQDIAMFLQRVPCAARDEMIDIVLRVAAGDADVLRDEVYGVARPGVKY